MFDKTTQQQQQQHIVNSNIQYMNTDTKNSLRVMFYSQRQWGWLAGEKNISCVAERQLEARTPESISS